MNIRRILTVLLAAIFISAVFLPAWGADSFRVIVNSANFRTEISRDDIARAFLKKIVKWDKTNEPIKPVDLAEGSEVRNTFSQQILEKRVAAVKAYWQNRIFSGRGVPPPEKETEKKVLEYVQDNPGAIGYIGPETGIEEYAVKIVKITEN